MRVVAIRDSKSRYGVKYKANDEFEIDKHGWVVTDKGEWVCQVGSLIYDVDFKVVDESDYIMLINDKIYARGNLKYMKELMSEIIDRGLYNRDYYKFEIAKPVYVKKNTLQ